MPTYEYECASCGLRFELRQAMAELPAEACPTCGGAVRRLVTGGAGFAIKGQGGGVPSRDARACSFAENGRTCCGRETRCSEAPCEERS